MLSPTERDQVATYVDDLLDIFHLTEWIVILDDETVEECDARHGEATDEVSELRGLMSTVAKLTTFDGRFLAVLRLTEAWSKVPPAVQKDTLIHEVLHLTHSSLSTIAMSGILSGGRNSGVVWNLFSEEIERMVDRMSGVISFAMPVWPPKKTTSEWRRVRGSGEWF